MPSSEGDGTWYANQLSARLTSLGMKLTVIPVGASPLITMGRLPREMHLISIDQPDGAVLAHRHSNDGWSLHAGGVWPA
jgi:hypothetical protein